MEKYNELEERAKAIGVEYVKYCMEEMTNEARDVFVQIVISTSGEILEGKNELSVSDLAIMIAGPYITEIARKLPCVHGIKREDCGLCFDPHKGVLNDV